MGTPVEATIDPKTGDVTVNEDVIVRNSALPRLLQLVRATG